MAWTLKAELVFFCREQAKTIKQIVAEIRKRDPEASETWIEGLTGECERVGLLYRTATPQEDGYQTTKLGLKELHRYQLTHSIYGD